VDALHKNFTVSIDNKPLRSILIENAPGTAACDDETPIQLSAKGVFGTGENTETRDITDEVSWTSLTPATLSVNASPESRGEVTTRAEGTATVQASATAIDGTQVSTTAQITVSPPTAKGVEIRSY